MILDNNGGSILSGQKKSEKINIKEKAGTDWLRPSKERAFGFKYIANYHDKLSGYDLLVKY